MPVAILYSNIPKEKFDSNFRIGFIKILSETLAKPENGIALILNTGFDCTFGVTDEQNVILSVSSQIPYLI